MINIARIVSLAGLAVAIGCARRRQSRVGGNDFGMNAKRIRAFQARLKAAVG
jgi:uncharacterized protein (DUF1499 family)